MPPRTVLVLSLLLAACGGDDGTGPEPPANLTGQLAYIGDGMLIRDLATGETRHIELNTQGLGAVWGLAWQPDGRALVYAPFNLDRGWYELHRVPVDGSPATVLFPSEGHQLAPAFTLDGRLSYWVNGVDVAGESHGYEIFVDGQPFSPPLYASASGSRAAWAPDGASVVIVRRVEGADRLIKVSIATGTETVILEAGGDQSVEQLFNPVYSHAGDRLALTRIFFGPNQSERDEIWVVNADGSNPQRLVTGHADDMATWSPDDAWVAFTRTEDPVASIGIVSAAGGATSILVKGAIAADWR